MKNILLTALLLLLCVDGLDAQQRRGLVNRRSENMHQITFSLGPGFCFGEAGSSYNQTFANGLHNFTTELGFRNVLQNGFSYKANLEYGNFSGSDAGSYLEMRKFSNISHTISLSGRAEYSYYFGRRYARFKPNSIFVYGGLGLLTSFTQNTGIKQLYREEKPVALGPIAPFGGGYMYQFNQQYSMGVELWSQYAFFDFVDGFHSKKYSRSNDVLAGFKVTLAYRIF